jgi:hypothetical protein
VTLPEPDLVPLGTVSQAMLESALQVHESLVTTST